MPQLGKVLVCKYASVTIARLAGIYLWGITASQVLSWQQSKSAVDKDIKEIREFSADTIQFSLISLNSLNSLSLDSHAKLRFAQNDG